MLAETAPLATLVAAIVIGRLKHVNIGLISIAGAFFIGRFLVGLPPGEIISGWPLRLFFMLLGMTLLFGIAAVNGTLGLIAQKTVSLTRGHRRLIPPVFFILSGVLAALGPGNISICALILPIALAVSRDQDIPPVLTISIVIAGANAGGLSPIAPTGIIGATLAREIGLDIAGRIFLRQIIGQTAMAATLYFLLGGHRLHRKADTTETEHHHFNRVRKITVLVLLLVVAAILFGRWDIGLTAFTGALVLLLAGAAEEKTALAAVPWSTLILVCGVGVLVNVADKSGGIARLTDILAGVMRENTSGPIMAVIGGILSIVSSASGVVMPTLIPTAPGLAERVGGDAVQIISAVIMGAHVVTTSPISTLGALAMAAAGPEINRTRLFNQLMVIAVAGLFYSALLVFIGMV